MAQFAGMETQVLGLSVDSGPCLKAWADSLGGVTYPLLSDFFPHGKVSELFGVLRPEGFSERAIFVLDKQGLIRYIDIHDITQQPNNDELFRVLGELEPELAKQVQAAAQAAPPPSAAPDSALILYCTSWCPDCRRARAYLKEHNIAYTEIDIGRDRAAAAKVRGWANGNETTPTFDIKGTILVNFDQAKLNAALGIK